VARRCPIEAASGQRGGCGGAGAPRAAARAGMSFRCIVGTAVAALLLCGVGLGAPAAGGAGGERPRDTGAGSDDAAGLEEELRIGAAELAAVPAESRAVLAKVLGRLKGMRGELEELKACTMTHHQQPVWAGPPPHHQQPTGEDHRRGPSAGPQQQPIWPGPSPPYQQQAMSAEPYVRTPSAPATHASAALRTQPKGSPHVSSASTAERFSSERSVRAHSRKVLVRKVDARAQPEGSRPKGRCARAAERFSSKEQNLFDSP
jgi:hypothetical protein